MVGMYRWEDTNTARNRDWLTAPEARFSTRMD